MSNKELNHHLAQLCVPLHSPIPTKTMIFFTPVGFQAKHPPVLTKKKKINIDKTQCGQSLEFILTCLQQTILFSSAG